MVYASSDTDLYSVDPASPAQLTHLCAFKVDGGALGAALTDIAVERGGGLFGVTEQDLYGIDERTCELTRLASLSSDGGTRWVCLAFTATDALIAADQQGDVVQIDTSTGAVTSVGSFGGPYGCSGDLVAIDDAAQTIYASATDSRCSGTCDDVLVTLSSANGYAATPVGNIGYRAVYGMGYWAGALYGFTHTGQTIQIDPDGGAATLLHTTNPAITFSGGATTPLAPR